MNTSLLKFVLDKISKYIAIVLVAILALTFLTPTVFSDKIKEEIKEEIKKKANQKLAEEMNYSNVNIYFSTFSRH